MKCLSCGTEMTRCQVGDSQTGMAYDLCEKCGGLWLDRGELDRAAYTVDGSIEFCSTDEADESDAKPLACPRCDDADLVPVRFLGVTEILLHHCQNCGGFWLNGGQLEKVDSELAADGPVHGHGFSDFILGIQAPYWRSRVRRTSSANEPHPKATPIPGAKAVGDTNEICPTCGAHLAQYEATGTRFHGCPACKGVWLAPQSLRHVKDRAGVDEIRWLNDEINALEHPGQLPTVIMPGAPGRACPQCSPDKLVSTVFGHSSLVVDWCPTCHGIWLDRDEFERLIEYLKRERNGMNAHQIARLVEDDVKRIVLGGPEGRLEQLGDLGSALGALYCAAIYEHPKLAAACLSASTKAHETGV